jgi:hypothetical protein
MGISVELAIGIVLLTVLGLLLTGPGMWSEKWGWKRLAGRREDDARERGAPREPDEPDAGPGRRATGGR